jgi:phage major head subunit gpT-like protein
LLITNASLEALRTGFRAEFQKGVNAKTSQYEVMTTKVPSSTKVETYGFLGDFPIFRKWVGEKRIRSMTERAYQLVNDSFEATIGIHKDKIRDDNLGLYGPLVQGWGQDAGALNDRLAFEALANGHVRVCFDGQNYFDTDHPMGREGATLHSNINAAGAVQPWYLLDCSKPLKPILLQEREAPTFQMVVDPTDSHVFKTGEYLMGGEARAAAGYTYWQLAYRSTATLNEANYKAACDAMAAIVDDEGEPAGIKPTHIVVGTSNKVAARTLFKKANLTGGESNIYFEDVVIVEAQRYA